MTEPLIDAIEAVAGAIMTLRERLHNLERLAALDHQRINELEQALDYERTLRHEGK